MAEPGELLRIWIKRASGGPMEAVSSAQLDAGAGLAGNADRGGRRQVTLIQEEKWAEAMEALGGARVDPSARRANLLVRGVDLSESAGRVLRVGACRMRVRGETRPCEQMNRAFAGLRDALRPEWRGGAYAEVLDSGAIELGAAVGWE